jgi:hypothetical protein
MVATTNVPFPLKKIAVASAIALLSGQTWPADIVADGKLDSTNGSIYQLGYTIGFLDDKGNSIGDGRLYFGIDSIDNTQFLYFQLPVNYVDNTYGTTAAADWGKTGHTFNDLLGSDRWGVYDKKKATGGFEWDGNSVSIDYIAEVTKCTAVDKGKCKTTVVDGYKSAGVLVNSDPAGSVGALGWNKSEGNVNAGSAGSILEIATSLEYDFNQYGLTYLTNSPLMTSNTLPPPASNISYVSTVAPNWIYEVGYEIQFAAGTFNSNDWLDPLKAYTLITLGVVHASPSKVDYTDYGNPVCVVGCSPPQPVPEPGSLLLLGAGLGALGWARRRRRRRTEDTG